MAARGTRGPASHALWLVLCGLLVSPTAAGASGSVYVANYFSQDVTQYSIGAGGQLSPLTPDLVFAGTNPLGIAVSPDGKSAYVTNISSFNVSQYDINPLTGALSPKNPVTVATGADPGGIAVTPDGRSAYVANEQGDTVSQYDVNPVTGALSSKNPATVAAANAPIQVAVSPDGKSAYVTNQSSDIKGNSVSQYNIDPVTGSLSPKTPATVDSGGSAFAIAVTPDGGSVYVTNNGPRKTIFQYSVDSVTGALSPKNPASVATGTEPFGVAVTPDGRSAYVTNGSANVVSLYDIDPVSGRLSPKNPATLATGADPVGIAVTPDGKSAYVTNANANTVSQYDIDPLTGALSAKNPPTVVAASSPVGIAVGPLPLTSPQHSTATSVSCSPATVVAGQPTTCTATVTDTAPSGQTTPTGTVSFESSGPGSFSGGASCTLTGSGASASCSLTYTPSTTPSTPVRSDTITAAYGGDSSHAASSGSTVVQVLSIGLLARGSFVIGDENATVGTIVTFSDVEFWGSNWSNVNALSGGPAPAAFKGFAESSPNPPSCGESWTTNTGSSSGPPPAVPELMAVIASSSITMAGSTISGNAPKVVVVKTNPGYAPDPGHHGTGTVVAIVCG
jgi:DNA-binding beta-propeller fold protein YncE